MPVTKVTPKKPIEVGAKASDAVPETDPSAEEKKVDQKVSGKSFFRDDTYKPDAPDLHWKTT
jgi:hypothetical protein